MSIEKFWAAEPIVIEKESFYSSNALVLIELYKDVGLRGKGNTIFPEVCGYRFDWGSLAEYRIDNEVIWHFHFQHLLEQFVVRGGEGCEMVMRCLAYFDLDYWPDGTPFWGDGDKNLFWGKIVDRPDVKVGCNYLPKFIDISHSTETDALSISCCKEDEERARDWIGKEFLPVVLPEMIQSVEFSLY